MSLHPRLVHTAAFSPYCKICHLHHAFSDICNHAFLQGELDKYTTEYCRWF